MTAAHVPLTGDQADANSRNRAEGYRRRLIALFAFTIALFLILAALLQHEQTQQADLTRQMCLQRQANTIHTNATWDELADIERRSTFIDEDIRQSRLTAYRNAKLIVPACNG